LYALSVVTSMNDLQLTSRFFIYHNTAPSGIYPLSLHDALPISRSTGIRSRGGHAVSRSGSILALLNQLQVRAPQRRRGRDDVAGRVERVIVRLDGGVAALLRLHRSPDIAGRCLDPSLTAIRDE